MFGGTCAWRKLILVIWCLSSQIPNSIWFLLSPSSNMDEEKHWFERFTLCMEQNIRGVQYGIYSVALLGLAIAFRSVRPLQKFTRPQDIPISFIKNHMRFNGRVMDLEPPMGTKPALLLVDHHPIVSLNLTQRNMQCLPIEVSSIDISPNGMSWLQHVVVGSNIKFTVLRVDPHYASCIVQKDASDVGRNLVSLGFASVSAFDFALEKDPLYTRYYQQLLKAERRAEKKGTGMWSRECTLADRLWSKLKLQTNGFGLDWLRRKF